MALCYIGPTGPTQPRNPRVQTDAGRTSVRGHSPAGRTLQGQPWEEMRWRHMVPEPPMAQCPQHGPGGWLSVTVCAWTLGQAA